jgi:hypothetical protein
MTDQEKDKYESLFNYSQELELRIKVQQQRKALEAKEAETEIAFLGKLDMDEAEEYAPLADEISDSPTFKQRFCQLIANKNIKYLGDILDVATTIALEFNLPLGLVTLVVVKISKIAVNKYCDDLKTES